MDIGKHVDERDDRGAADRSRRAVAGRASSTPSAAPSRYPAPRVVVIDSLNGYLNAMPEERFLTIQLHELSHVPRAAERRHAPDRRATRD